MFVSNYYEFPAAVTDYFPPALESTVVWLRGDSLDVAANNNAIGWTDKSGRGNHFTPLTALNTDVLAVSDWSIGSNRRIVALSNSNFTIANTTPTTVVSNVAATGITLAFVQEKGTYIPYGTQGSLTMNNGYRFSIDLQQNSGNFETFDINFNDGSWYILSPFHAISNPGTVNYRYGFVSMFPNGEVHSYLNGVRSTNVTTWDTTRLKQSVGLVNNNTRIDSNDWDSNVMDWSKSRKTEIILYNRALTLTEMADLNTYFQNYYGF